MSAALLDQAAVLRKLAAARDEGQLGQLHFEATIECAERLNLTGHPGAALELVDSVLEALPAGTSTCRLRLEIQALRALALDFRDTECLERASRCVSTLAELESHHESDFAFLRVFHAVALFRTNRAQE